MTKKKNSGTRALHVKVKTADKRSIASTRWLSRQLNDPYVAKARAEGYRSRAAFKLIEMDEKYSLLKPGMRIVDLGCSPGGWAQVAAKKIGHRGKLVGCDLLEVAEIPGAEMVVLDFLEEDAPQKMKDMLGGMADLVMSDMAANTTGHTATDHLRIVHLCDLAYEFALEVLAREGAFICKVLKGGTEGELLKKMRKDFRSVKHAKPAASRSDSAESYVVAMGFRS
jgi:23S rRNA (uridine2552-2'-O)-methyltransferase